MACTLLLRAGLNFLGLAMLLPVLALVLDPGSLEGGGVLARAYAGLGFASPRSFALAVCAAVVGVIVLKCLTRLWLARVERNYIYDLYRTLAAALRHLPRPGTAVRQGVELGRTGPQRQRRLPGLRGGRAQTRRRHRRRGDAARAALRGADLVHAPRGTARRRGLPALDLALLRLVRNRINRYGELENKAQREKARLVAETFRGYADIEINNAFPMMLRPFDRAMDQVIRTRLRETAIGLLPQAFTEVGLAVGMALLVALSLGDGDGRAQMLFGVFAVAALRLMPSVRNIMAGWTAIKVQPLHDRHPARRRSGLPPGAGKPGLPGYPRPAQHPRRNRCPRQSRQSRQTRQSRQSREPRRRYRQLPRKAAVPARDRRARP